MGRLATRTAGPAQRSAQQVAEALRLLVQNNPELYSLEDAGALLDELLAVRPDLCCQPGACAFHKENR